jgi:hypothetical protein
VKGFAQKIDGGQKLSFVVKGPGAMFRRGRNERSWHAALQMA